MVDIKKMDLEDLKAEVYRREFAAEEKELEVQRKKNLRRREKMVSAAAPVKVAVLGGGPAGATAAIYAARAGLKPMVVSPPVGGQLMSKGVNVENYPGIFEASGGDIIKLMKKQVRHGRNVCRTYVTYVTRPQADEEAGATWPSQHAWPGSDVTSALSTPPVTRTPWNAHAPSRARPVTAAQVRGP